MSLVLSSNTEIKMKVERKNRTENENGMKSVSRVVLRRVGSILPHKKIQRSEKQRDISKIALKKPYSIHMNKAANISLFFRSLISHIFIRHFNFYLINANTIYTCHLWDGK